MHATTRHDRVTRVTLSDCSCQHNCSHVTVRHLRRSSEVQQPRTPQPRSPGGVHTAAAVARPEGNSHMVNEVMPALRRVPARQQGTSTSAPAPAPCSKTTQMGKVHVCASQRERERGRGKRGKAPTSTVDATRARLEATRTKMGLRRCRLDRHWDRTWSHPSNCATGRTSA